jgi:hypothetical protein
MAKIIPFPSKFIPPKPIVVADKSDLQQIRDKLIYATKNQDRSQGFMIGILVANIQNIIIQYFSK